MPPDPLKLRLPSAAFRWKPRLLGDSNTNSKFFSGSETLQRRGRWTSI